MKLTNNLTTIFRRFFIVCIALFFPGLVQAAQNTPANFKIAFFGDSGAGNGFTSVLNLVKGEQAKAVVHLGDFDYASNPNQFQTAINQVLDPNYPYIYISGNHDTTLDEGNAWPPNCTAGNGCYASHFQTRMTQAGLTIDLSDGGRIGGPEGDHMYTIDINGLRIVGVGTGDYDNSASGRGNAEYAPYIRRKLQNDDHIWKVCAWHMSQKLMQVGGKNDSMGWGVYDTCREMGAIVATAHEHTYHRTKTLSSMQNQTVDSTYSTPQLMRVEPGKTFAFVSGLGGNSIRDQQLCLPTTYPYGCKGEWAKIYTSNQQAQYGALFLVFNIDGDPAKARGYFKNINNQIVDQFDITTTGSSTQPTPTATATTNPTPTATATATTTTNPTPTATAQSDLNYCATDANRDGVTDLTDIAYITSKLLTNDTRADTNKDGIVDLTDYSQTVKNLSTRCQDSGGSSEITPTPTASATTNPTTPPQGSNTRLWSETSVFNQPIPGNATYTKFNNIGSFRQVYDEWSAPITRVPQGTNIPLVTASVAGSGRTVQWPIPTTANPATAEDGHMIVINRQTNLSYEFWDLSWDSNRTAISAGGMKDFPLQGSGISNPTYHRVVAAGFAVSAGMVIREDLTTATGQLSANIPIAHALTMAVPDSACNNTFVAPAVGSEESCSSTGPETLAMGDRLALPKNLNLDTLSVHPLTKLLLQATRDYGIFINDRNSSAPYNSKPVGTIRIEPGLTNDLFGVPSDDLIDTVQSQVYSVIAQHGLYKVTGISY